MEQLNLWGEKVEMNPKNKEITHKAKSYTGLYALHKYWGKKPYNIMSNFIKKYTSVNDIVLDPFLGSGVSITEAIFNGRKGFGIDINPSAVFITNGLIEQINIQKFIDEYSSIENDLKNKIYSFYKVSRNGQNYVGQNYLWENGRLSEIRYTNGSVKRISTKAEQSDYDLINEFNYKNIAHFFPDTNFFHNSRINTKSNEKIYELFTPRNLNAISLIHNRIQQIENENLRNIFLFCFTASIGQASKMVFVIKRRNKTKENVKENTTAKKEVGSWVIGYWKPKDFFENNAWTTFDTRVKKVLKAKKEQNKTKKNYIKTNSFKALQNGADYLLVNKPSQNHLQEIQDNSIDYILTDPPHGNRIPYLELSMLWNSWLQKKVNYSEEIIVSEAKERKKGIEDYNKLLKDVLIECFRVLKPNKYLSFMFNSLDDKAWINVISSFYEIGFELEAIETLNYSANSVVQDNRKNGLQTDFIITYRKNIENKIKKLEIINIQENKDIQATIKKLKSDNFKPFQIMNRVISDSLKLACFVNISELIKSIENA